MEDGLVIIDRSKEKPPSEAFIDQTISVATETLKLIEEQKTTQKFKAIVESFIATESSIKRP